MVKGLQVSGENNYYLMLNENMSTGPVALMSNKDGCYAGQGPRVNNHIDKSGRLLYDYLKVSVYGADTGHCSPK